MLVYEDTDDESKADAKHLQFREKFLNNLKRSNVEMEEVMEDLIFGENIYSLS